MSNSENTHWGRHGTVFCGFIFTLFAQRCGFASLEEAISASNNRIYNTRRGKSISRDSIAVFLTMRDYIRLTAQRNHDFSQQTAANHSDDASREQNEKCVCVRVCLRIDLRVCIFLVELNFHNMIRHRVMFP